MGKSSYDVIVVGSGVGGGTVAYALTKAGYRVALLEKGDFLKREAFSKDELAYCRRDLLNPNPLEEFHTVEMFEGGEWVSRPSYERGVSFFNGTLVGGSSNVMSGMFHRMHPDDFRLKQCYGEIEGANIEDWCIDYETLAPYYDAIEEIVGLSGVVEDAPFEPPRSSLNRLQPPTKENGIVQIFDSACASLALKPLVTTRAILSQSRGEREGCYYSNFCGSYGCSSGAKGSAREAMILPALKSGLLTLLSHHHVIRVLSDSPSHVTGVEVVETKSKKRKILYGDMVVLGAQAHESARLLLNSANRYHPYGLANSSKEVGRNLIFSAGGWGEGVLSRDTCSEKTFYSLMQRGYFFNRSIKEWYGVDDWWYGHFKGGLIEFMFEHQNLIARAIKSLPQEGELLWGEALFERLREVFIQSKKIRFEIFCDWLPTNETFLSLDTHYKDIYGMPVGKIRIFEHPRNQEVGNFLAKRAVTILEKMGAEKIKVASSLYPPPNLIAGGCRFGKDPKTSVLNPECRTHDVENLYVSDASFMPTGGSVPYTWTIYANALRVADAMIEQLHRQKA